MTPRTEAELAARSIRRSDNRVSVRRRHSERELVVLYQTDPSTRETVIEAFRPLAHSVAKRYHRGEEPLEDLRQLLLGGDVHARGRLVEDEQVGATSERPRDERPLLLVVRKPGSIVSDAEIQAHLARHVAKWWLPDAILFVDELPHTATGKLLKTALREHYKDFTLAAA